MSRAMTSPSMPPPPPPEEPRATSRGFGDSWRRVVTEPRAFFAEMPHVGGLPEPLIFLAICLGLNALGVLLTHMSFGAAVNSFFAMGLKALLLAVVLTLVTQQLFDGPAGFEPMLRVVAYAAAPLVLAFVPYAGGIAKIYAAFLAVRGIESVQRFDATKAVMSMAIGVALLAYAAASMHCGGGHHCPGR